MNAIKVTNELNAFLFVTYFGAVDMITISIDTNSYGSI